MSRNIFITGTGTDVGKTYVTGLIVKKLNESGADAAYYKAAMSGNDRGPDGTLYPGDALRVKELSGIPQPVEEMCPYVYEQAVSPHLAARWEGRPVQAEVVYAGFARLCAAYSWVTMEGSGGILCPIRLEEPPIWLPDLVQGLGLGCLLVAEAGLGTINQVGLTAAYLHRRGIPLQGIVLNRFQPGNPMHEDNRGAGGGLCPGRGRGTGLHRGGTESTVWMRRGEKRDDLVSLPADENHADTL